MSATRPMHRTQRDQRNQPAPLAISGKVVPHGQRNRLWEWEPTSGRYCEWEPPEPYLIDGASCPSALETLVERIHPGDREGFNQALRSVVTGVSDHFEIDYRYRERDGSYCWITTHGRGVTRAATGDAMLVTGSHVDISTAKAMEARLARKESELDLILESSSQCSWEWKVAENTLSLPRSWYELFGYSQSEVTKELQSISAFAHPDEVKSAQETLIKALKGQIELYDIQQRMRHKDGHYLHCLVRARVAERDEHGRALRITGTTTDITALKKVQDALHDSTSKLNFALESSQHGIWEWKPATDELSITGHVDYLDESDLTTPVISGHQFSALTHPEDRDRVRDALIDYLCGHSSIFSEEQRVRMRDGSYRTLLALGQSMEYDSDGRIVRMVGTHTDITDQKAHQQRLEIALKNGRQGQHEWRPQSDTVKFSDSWYALYGYSKGDIKNVSVDMASLVHPDDFESLKTAVAKVLKGPDNDYSVEYRFKCKNGEYLWVMERTVVVERDSRGRATFLVGTYVDIQQQKAVEQELLESRRFLKLVLDTIPDFVHWKDTDSRYLGANRQFALNAGFADASEIVGLSDADMPWAENASIYQSVDREVMQAGEAMFQVEHTFVDARGVEHLIDTSKVPLLDESENTVGVLAISHDVTGKRRHEKQLEKFAECISGRGNGRLLDALAQGAVELTGISVATVAKLNGDGRTATIVSTFPDNPGLQWSTYEIENTPCAVVAESDFCIYQDNVQAAFPGNHSLVESGLESYVGKRLLDGDGELIGIFALLDVKPLQDPEYARSVLDIVAESAAVELQREYRELALAQSEERYRTTYDNVPVIICTVDETGKITDVNNAWIEATGFSVSESIGTTLADYFAPDVRYRYLAMSRDVANPNAVDDLPLRFVCKDGMAIRVAHSAVRTVSSEGIPVTITVLKDITSQFEAEQQLKLAATAFETHEALVIRDSNKRILRVNKAYKTITGYNDDEVIGTSPAHFARHHSDTGEQTTIWETVERTGTWDGEQTSYRADGNAFSAWHTITAVRDNTGAITHYVENFTDVSELKQALADAERLALYDPLTQLPNRRYLMEQLESNISHSRRHGATGALLFIDLDNFKNINDSLGHAVGDALLVEVAKRLTHLMRQEDTIARLGGDEFVVVLPELGRDPGKSVDQARRVAEKIHAELGRSYDVDDHQLTVTPTIGVTLFPEDGKTVEAVLQQADSAMYQGKADGRNITKFFHPGMHTEAQLRLSLERDLRTAAERGELQLHYQPQYNVSGEIFAAETLLRWNHPSRGYVSPADFIPIAEESGLILEIGRWVFEQALECLRCWEHNKTLFLHHLAVNVSSRQFRSPNFVREITRGLVSAGVPPELLVIEVTEGTVIENFEETARKMEELRDIGIRFSVDDFGVGYSSLSYLSRLPLDQLKIDRSFVTNVLQDPNDTVIAETIIGMGRNLHLQTIAEGVETETQLNFLREHGCDGFQGFLFSKPVPESEFLALDRRWSLAAE